MCEPVVVLAGGTTGWLQSADVIVQDHESSGTAMKWAGRMFGRYPGCAVVGGRHVGGDWLLIGIRDRPPLVIRAGTPSVISLVVADQVLRVVFHLLATGVARQTTEDGGER